MTFKSARMRWLVEEKLVFLYVGYRHFMDNDSEHRVDDFDDGWVLDCEYIGEEESEIVSESNGNITMSTVEM